MFVPKLFAFLQQPLLGLTQKPSQTPFLRDLCVLCGSLRQAAPRLRFLLPVRNFYKYKEGKAEH